MIALVLALVAHSATAETKARALKLCRPGLERQVGGEIQTIDVSSARSARSGLTIRGGLTAFLGMAAPQPGHASTHHLIRAEFTYSCKVRAGRVRHVAAKPLQ